jgi:hypothetical protein
MKCIEFYRGERPNHVGQYGWQMMKYSHFTMETDHDYIQWMFPSNEPSAFNSDAPVMTHEEALLFQNSPKLQERIRDSFVKFLDFLGLQYTRGIEGVVSTLEPTPERPNPLDRLAYFNHNMLRITRVLTCLRLVGLHTEMMALYNFLANKIETDLSDWCNEDTFTYWQMAVYGDLW